MKTETGDGIGILPRIRTDEKSDSDKFFQSAIRAHSSRADYSQKIEALLKQMTVEEKVGQMTQLTLAMIVNGHQLYVTDLVASIAPAGRRLKRFAKISLRPGQSRTLNFNLRREDLSFIGNDNHSVAEPGNFDVMIGGLSAGFTLK